MCEYALWESKRRDAEQWRTREFDEASALDAAMDCFWKDGYEATSVRDLAARMGIARGLGGVDRRPTLLASGGCCYARDSRIPLAGALGYNGLARPHPRQSSIYSETE
jgi:Bacterial regulatory proteins, tetR family